MLKISAPKIPLNGLQMEVENFDNKLFGCTLVLSLYLYFGVELTVNKMSFQEWQLHYHKSVRLYLEQHMTITQWHKIVGPLFHLSTLHKYYWHFDHCSITLTIIYKPQNLGSKSVTMQTMF